MCGGVLESSGPPLDDGHRDLKNENESAVLIDANCMNNVLPKHMKQNEMTLDNQ